MEGKVMLLFDSLRLRGEAVEYAVELAKRMEYSLFLLVLLASDSGEAKDAGGSAAIATDELEGHLEFARRAGIAAQGEIRVGKPNSELMKFLAESRAVQIIVWGGNRDAVDSRQNRGHWLNRMKEVLGCPVVVPLRKSNH